MKNVILIIFFALFLSACVGQTSVDTSVDNTKIKVATTIYPLSSIAHSVAGDRVEIVNVLSPGVSPHAFTLRPSDFEALQGASVVFAIGGPLDAWVLDIVETVGDVKVVYVDDGIDLRQFENGENDPHYWLSTDNANVIAGNIFNNLKELDKENESYFEQNLQGFIDELNSTKIYVQDMFAYMKNKNIITFHDSWGYFADEFGLTVAGVFEISPGVAPGPKDLKKLYDLADGVYVNSVFSEYQFSDDVVASFGDDLDLNVAVLDPLGGVEGRDSYIQLIRYNADVIFNASNE